MCNNSRTPRSRVIDICKSEVTVTGVEIILPTRWAMHTLSKGFKTVEVWYAEQASKHNTTIPSSCVNATLRERRLIMLNNAEKKVRQATVAIMDYM